MLGIFETFIFLCVFGYFLNKARAKDMVDVLQNYMQDALSLVRMPRAETSNHDDHGTTNYGAKRRATENLRRRNQLKEDEKKSNDQCLYQIKETTLQPLQISSKPLNGITCKFCAPMNDGHEITPDVELAQADVIDILRVQTYNRSSKEIKSNSIFSWDKWFPYLAHCLRVPRLPYPQVAPAVLKDNGLNSAIENSVKKAMDEIRMSTIDEDEVDEDEQYERLMTEHKQRAKKLLLDMRSKISDYLLRFASLVIFKLLPSFMSGVIAHPVHIDMLKKVAKANPDVPLIFLPLHRSHLDYILVSMILYNNEIRSPIVAAGDNLRIPVFGALLRGLGAFYIKCKIDPVAGKKDIVYRAVLHTYMQHALKAGHNVEFFIEGGRTRTGKPCVPKSGVLSVVIDALNANTIKDALLVPVSVNYERLCDGNFVYEQMGETKKPEKFTSAASAIWKILNSKYGQMRIDFNKPFSLRELMKAFERSAEPSEMSPAKKRLRHQPSTSSLYGTDVVNEDHRALVDSIARHVVYDCATVTACMTTNAVAFLLLTRFRDGDTVDVLADALDELRNTLQGVRTINFTGKSRDIVEYAAKLLGPTLITVEEIDNKMFIKPVKDVRSFIELSYYSNSLAAHFALDSVVMCTLLRMASTQQQNSDSQSFQVNMCDLIQQCKQYCDMLRYEFLFNKPCQKLENQIEESFEHLKEQQLLTVPEQNRKFRGIYLNDDSDDGYDNEPDGFTITLPSDGHGKRVVLTSVLAPYSDAYIIVAETLDKLRGYGLMESEFIKSCIQEITNQVTKGLCKYEESISTDTVRNCMKMMEKSHFIEITNVNGTRIVSLHKKYDSADGVREITEQIKSIVTISS